MQFIIKSQVYSITQFILNVHTQKNRQLPFNVCSSRVSRLNKYMHAIYNVESDE